MPMSPRLLRPRQAGGFDPRTIAGIVGWYDGSKISGTSGDPVSQWDDLSGANLSGRNLVQSTEASRPTVTTAGSRKAVAFNGSSQWMRQSALTAYAHQTSFIVFSRNGTAGAFGGVYGHRATGNASGVGISNSDAGFLLNTISSTANGSSLHLQRFGSPLLPNYTARVRGAAVTLGGSQDSQFIPSPVETAGALACVTSISDQTQSGNKMLVVGIDPNNVARTYGMTLCELILYGPLLSVAQMQAVENYLISKWAVP
jgi:hypothetical protein